VRSSAASLNIRPKPSREKMDLVVSMERSIGWRSTPIDARKEER